MSEDTLVSGGEMSFDAELAEGIAAGLAESGAEAGAEGGAEAGAEGGAEAGAEGGAEAGAEGGAEAGAEGGAEAGAEGGAEAGAEGGAEAGAEGGAEAGAEGGAEAGAEGGAEAGAEEIDDNSPDPSRWSRKKLLQDRQAQVGRLRSHAKPRQEHPTRPVPDEPAAKVVDLNAAQEKDLRDALEYLEGDPQAAEIETLFREDSPQGARARKLLADYEAPTVMQELRHVVNTRATTRASRESERARVVSHLETIHKVHPDVVDAMMAEDPSVFEEVTADVMRYIYGLSPDKRREALAVWQGGSASEQIKLLDDYKAKKTSPTPPAPPKPTAKQKAAASAAAAVPSGGPSFVPRGGPDPDDLEAGIKAGLEEQA